MTPSGEVTFCLKRVFQGEGLQPQIITDVHSRCSAKGTKNIQVAIVRKYFCPFLFAGDKLRSAKHLEEKS